MKKILLFLTFVLCFASSSYTQGGLSSQVRYGASLPATCTANTGQLFSLTSGTKGLYECKTTNTWTIVSGSSSVDETGLSFTDITTANASTTKHGLLKKLPNNATLFFNGAGNYTTPNPFGSNTLNPADYGVVADGKLCLGISSTIVITNSSTSVQCSTANFTSADIGKAIFGTSGCCGQGVPSSGQVCLPRTTISSITNSTTVVVASAATCTPSGTSGELFWGTNDDTAWNLVDTAYQAATNCPVVLMPSGMTLWTTAKFNVQSSNCENTSSGINQMDYAGAFVGLGKGSSIVVIAPDIAMDAGCTYGTSPQLSCFFSFRQAVLRSFGMTGAGAGILASTPTNPHCIVGGGYGSEFQDVSFAGFAGGTGNTIGVCVNSGTRVGYITNDAFGNIGGSSTDYDGSNAWNYCTAYCFWGDNKTYNFLAAGTTPFVDFGGEYGICTASSCIGLYASNYIGYGSSLFSNSGTHMGVSSTGIRVAGTNVILHDTVWDNSGCTGGDCNGLLLDNGATLRSFNSSFTGHGAGGGLNGFYCSSACKFIDGGAINTIGSVVLGTHVTYFGSPSATGTAQTAANITPSTNWGTSGAAGNGVSAVVGQTMSQSFTITAAGTPGASPTIAIVFPSSFLAAPAYCVAVQTGGTGANQRLDTTTGPSASGVTFTWNGTPVAASTYKIQVSCHNN